MKVPVAILGATGYVGQRLVALLSNHPYFEIRSLIASSRSAGKSYGEVMADRWQLVDVNLPESVAPMRVKTLDDADSLADIKLVFSAVNLPKEEVYELEEELAKRELFILSNNSAHRRTPDVPLLIPEVNNSHLGLIEAQRKRLGTKFGAIIAKPNCSLQTYVPALTPLLDLGIEKIFVSTYQAVSGAGKRLSDWPEMQENMIPYIGGEEEKSEWEPTKIWGELKDSEINLAKEPKISAHCCRVSVNEGHTACVSFSLRHKVGVDEIKRRWEEFNQRVDTLGLPNAPVKFLHYIEDTDRPQPKLDVDSEGGMAVSIGRLREDPIFDFKFVCLSHNTLRGAAGGSVLSAEYLYRKGYFEA